MSLSLFAGRTVAPIKNQQDLSFCFSFSQALEVLSHIQCAEAFTIYEVLSVIEEIREKLQNQVGCLILFILIDYP